MVRSRLNSSKFFLVVVLLTVSLVATAFAGENLLSYVPKDTTTVGMVKISELRSGAVTSRLFQDTDKMTCDGEAARFIEEAGIKPSEDLDTVLIAVSPKEGDARDGNVLVVFEGRFDVDRLSQAIVKRGGLPQIVNGKTYLRLPNDDDHDRVAGAIAFVSRSLTLAGSEESVRGALSRDTSGASFEQASGIGRELSRIDQKATAWMLVDVPRSARLHDGPEMPNRSGNQVLHAALRNVSTLALWAKEGNDELRFGASALAADEETRQLLEDTLRGALAAWRMAAQEKHPEWVSVIRQFKVSQSNDGVTLSGAIPASLLQKHANRIADAR